MTWPDLPGWRQAAISLVQLRRAWLGAAWLSSSASPRSSFCAATGYAGATKLCGHFSRHLRRPELALRFRTGRCFYSGAQRDTICGVIERGGKAMVKTRLRHILAGQA